MAADISRVRSLKNSLETKGEEFEALQALNTLLDCSSSNAEVLQVCSVIGPQDLFVFVSTGNSSDELDLVCSVLTKMLNAFPSTELVRMSRHIELGLQHLYKGVRKMCLKLIREKVEMDEIVREMVLQPTMFHLITHLVSDECLECAKYANDIILSLMNNSSGFLVVSSNLREGFSIDLEGVMGKSDTVRFRVYELGVKISSISREAFEFINNLGLITKLIGELESDDVLLKLNCMELLQLLMESPHGVDFVESADVLQKLHHSLISTQDDPFATVLIPGILKFFGHYCLRHVSNAPRLCSQYPNFLKTILSLVHMPEEDTVWGVAVDTLGILGSTSDGRKALMILQGETELAIKKLWVFINQSKSDLRLRALMVLSTIFSCPDEEESISYEWYKLTLFNPLSTVMSIVKQPFFDLHCAGLRLILSLSSREWGQREMQRCPGFVEYLLDRKTETEKNGKELKFDIISNLANSSSAESVFGSLLFLKFKEYEREGAFFVRVETSVALED